MSHLSPAYVRPGQNLFALQEALQGETPDVKAFIKALRIFPAGNARVKIGHEDGCAFVEIEVSPKPLGELKVRHEIRFDVVSPGQVQEIERYAGHLQWEEACVSSGTSFKDLSPYPTLVEAAFAFLQNINNPERAAAQFEYMKGQAKKYSEDTYQVLDLVQRMNEETFGDMSEKPETTKAAEDFYFLLSQLERRMIESFYDFQCAEHHRARFAEGELQYEKGFLYVEDGQGNELAMQDAYVLHLSKPDGSRICRIFSKEFETPADVLSLLESVEIPRAGEF